MEKPIIGLMLLLICPAASANDSDAPPVPRASTLPLEDLLAGPKTPLDLPKAAPGELPDKTQQGVIDGPTSNVAAPRLNSDGAGEASLPAERSQGQAPVANLNDTPELAEDQKPRPATTHPPFAHGVVLERVDDALTLVGDTGFVHQWSLPAKVHLISLSDSSLAERDQVGPGDFVARIGVEEGTNIPIVAFLELGEQPAANHEDLAPSIEACYEQAVSRLEMN